jgi:sugar/nucleoside kinase (ribokinase family)
VNQLHLHLHRFVGCRPEPFRKIFRVVDVSGRTEIVVDTEASGHVGSLQYWGATGSGEDHMKRLVALTLGAEGAVLLQEGEEIARAEPPRVEAVDGTAAGDAFTACLLVSVLEGRDHEEALRRSCAAGALAASRFGARPSLPTAAEIDEILTA